MTANGTKVKEKLDTQETLNIASQGIAALEKINGDPGTLTLTNGIVLKIKSTPPLLLRTVAAQVVDPEPPDWFNPDKERNEPNPADPAYEATLRRNEILRQAAVADAVLMLGTELYSLPPGKVGPEDETWLADVRAVGLDVDPKTEKQRYLVWLRYYAIEINDDITDAISAALGVVGLTEEDVASAMASFRRIAERRADSEFTNAGAVSTDGDIVPADGAGVGSGD